MKTSKKPIHFITYVSIRAGCRHFKVWWGFILHILYRFILSLKNIHFAYIPLYMHKTLRTLGNEKEQQQIKFYKKSLGELIFWRATKNLKIFYFTLRLHQCCYIPKPGSQYQTHQNLLSFNSFRWKCKQLLIL